MSRRPFDEFVDDLIDLFRAVPWWVGPPAAIITFMLFGFVIPFLFALVTPSTPQGMSSTAFGFLTMLSKGVAPTLTIGIVAIWLVALFIKRQDRNRLDSQQSLDTIRTLSWQHFESLLAEYFRRIGYNVQTTPDGPDGGIDLILHKDGRETLVQAKHWRARQVGVAPVRELFGVQTARRAAASILVTSGRFTPDARAFAETSGVRLIDGDALEPLIQGVRNTIPAPRPAPTPGLQPAPPPAPQQPIAQPTVSPDCPTCAAPMVQRTARQGPRAGSRFWGCTRYPACKGTRNIG